MAQIYLFVYFILWLNIALSPFYIISTLPYSLVREQVRDLLLLKGVVFGEFVATEFSNPLLQEHILSVTVTDISHEIQVLLYYNPTCTCVTCLMFSYKLYLNYDWIITLAYAVKLLQNPAKVPVL